MKIIKKILKCIAILGALFGFAKIVCKFCKTTIKMNAYNKQAVFTGDSMNYDEEPFEKESVAALFSGVEMDFENATMKNKSSMLEIFGRFAGIQVVVPKHWRVELDGVEKSSGISNSTEDNTENEEAPVLNINYDLKFSGLDITNPDEGNPEEDNSEEIIEDVIEIEDLEEIEVPEVEEEVLEEVIEIEE